MSATSRWETDAHFVGIERRTANCPLGRRLRRIADVRLAALSSLLEERP
jgi:hypothetical protein